MKIIKPDMAKLIELCIAKEIKAKDIFNLGDGFYDSLTFFNKLMENKSAEYRREKIDRIMSNRPGDKFYDALAAFVSSKSVNKLEPVSLKRMINGIDALDGSHRSALCFLLDIKMIPFKEII